jgi:hypothetical protein
MQIEFQDSAVTLVAASDCSFPGSGFRPHDPDSPSFEPGHSLSDVLLMHAIPDASKLHHPYMKESSSARTLWSYSPTQRDSTRLDSTSQIPLKPVSPWKASAAGLVWLAANDMTPSARRGPGIAKRHCRLDGC